MMKVAVPTEKQLKEALPSGSASTPTTCMALSSPPSKTPKASSGQLSREQVDALVSKLKDRRLARQFLMDAGLIDENGELARPYRSQDARKAK